MPLLDRLLLGFMAIALGLCMARTTLASAWIFSVSALLMGGRLYLAKQADERFEKLSDDVQVIRNKVEGLQMGAHFRG